MAGKTGENSTPHEIEAARAGDTEAMGQLLESCRTYLLAVADRGLGADLGAKLGTSDLVQEALLGAFRDFGRFEGRTRDELLAWLRTILQNQIAVSVRYFRGTQKRFIGREVEAGAQGASVLWEGVTSDSTTPGSGAARREEIETLRIALARLREDDRRVVVWHQYDGLSFKEIGHRLGRSDEAARKLWSRALIRLTEELARVRSCPPETT